MRMVANEMGINGWIWNMAGVQIYKTGLDKGMRDKESSRFQSWTTGWHCHWRKSGEKKGWAKMGLISGLLNLRCLSDTEMAMLGRQLCIL